MLFHGSQWRLTSWYMKFQSQHISPECFKVTSSQHRSGTNRVQLLSCLRAPNSLFILHSICIFTFQQMHGKCLPVLGKSALENSFLGLVLAHGESSVPWLGLAESWQLPASVVILLDNVLQQLNVDRHTSPQPCAFTPATRMYFCSGNACHISI